MINTLTNVDRFAISIIITTQTRVQNERMYASYYRIKFYGEKFEELNQQAFIYREPPTTHLFDLSDRLKVR